MKPRINKYTFRDTDLFYTEEIVRDTELYRHDFDVELDIFADSLKNDDMSRKQIEEELVYLMQLKQKKENSPAGVNEAAAEDYIDSVLYRFLKRNPKHNELVELNARKHNLGRNAILATHGAVTDGKWYYLDDRGNHFLVQGWINRMDGEYAALILEFCNPKPYEVHSRKSAVLTPDFLYSTDMHADGKIITNLYLPGKGFIDSYLIDQELREMRESLGK